jgi:hypothetical protein
MKICFQAFIHDVSTKSAPLTSLKLLQVLVSALDITEAVASVDEYMLRSVWTELDCRIDSCRVTKGSHIEHL